MLRHSNLMAVLVIGFVLVAPGCAVTDTRPATTEVGQGTAARADRQIGAPLFDDLGDYHRPITTRSAEAQRYFDQGLTLVYAFNHGEAIRSFREAARLDPLAPMPWWGIALAHGPNINQPMSEEAAPKAWAALQKARELAENGTPREQAFISALSARYLEQPPEDRAELDRAYAREMGRLVQQYPDDLDAATLYAEALMDTMPWDYWTRDGEPRAETKKLLSALERVLVTDPDHPGANHYYIHAVEAVEPERALEIADRLGDLVPGAGHLVHMPSHIYLRLGLYGEATLANEQASKADESYIAQCRAQGFYPALYYPHNVHFLWYTTAMEGRGDDSIAAARKIAGHAENHDVMEAQRLRPLVVMTMARFGRWDEVLEEETPPADRKFESAFNHHARGLALIRKERLADAAQQLDMLERIVENEGRESFDSPYLPGEALVQIARHDLAGHLALARGSHGEAIEHLRQAVEIEDELPYMEPPFSYMPMRHGLGAALLAAGQPAEAEMVYRKDLELHPNNGWSLTGLEQSLRAQGHDRAAEEVRRQREQAWIRADDNLSSSRL